MATLSVTVGVVGGASVCRGLGPSQPAALEPALASTGLHKTPDKTQTEAGGWGAAVGALTPAGGALYSPTEALQPFCTETNKEEKSNRS